MKIDLLSLTDQEKKELVNNRWASSSEVWEVVDRTYKQNIAIYSNQSSWLENINYVRKKWIVQANRIFVNVEAVINSLIANPPGINILPSRDGELAQEFAINLEKFFEKKYVDLNTKEVMRMALRNLYFARLLVIKPFWNPLINDFDFRAIDPRKIRVGKYARKEIDTEFIIEEIEDNLCSVCERFPKKKDELMKKFGINDEAQLYIKNPDVTYKEAWIQDYVIFKLEDIILGCIKNPYWDWDGLLITEQEDEELKTLEGEGRRRKLQEIKGEQESRQQEIAPPPEKGILERGVDKVKSLVGLSEEQPQEQAPQPSYKSYYYNYFDFPRKPYIFATIFNNDNGPIGKTDMITLSSELQRGIDKRKMDIDENCELANGIVKVDAEVMTKSDAQRIRWETKGIIWGKGVVNGVQRETGGTLPQMVFDDMIDSRSEIDNIMAATSAFRGERQGQETKAGRLALIQQSYLRLNELVQVVDFAYREMFSWGMQLGKTRYTEYHYAKWMGKEGAQQTLELIQDDFETGSEVTIIAGKTLPRDDEFKFEQAQNDVEKGYISPVDYLEIAQYDNSKELARNAVLYQQNPMEAVGIAQGEMPVPFIPGSLTPEQVLASTPQMAGQQSATIPQQ